MAGTSLQKIYCWRIKLDRLYVYMASTEKGAVRIGMSLNSKLDATTFFKNEFPDSELLENHHENQPLERAVEAAFSHEGTQDGLDLDIDCTPFQWSAMKAIARIPFGDTRTYKEVAAMAGKPKGARAVGQAIGRNPLPLIFP
jgi:O6-methylguanine-DNA--protein-cysteine methyltransferase